ncbi:PTS fructose IIA subunit family protein [Lysobacter ciconiae]|uniref:PTS fructose IIA subunit family protein n=1 Tax=Novilysobacter ciconiae TaxID=2781022 RepID=A0A7S6ZSU4_9GAMM|nr:MULTISPECIES: PTS fructose IIA subunit family protein [Lysobacter]QOW20237.1 PTS fructose IIA subunit family protein [Lysobacter ciconiae]QOY63444.1 PTS fructose IIA subunit family protein [Lysobacter sp. H21R4]
MSVGILLLTHEGIGSAILAVASGLLKPMPLRVEVLEVGFDGHPDAVLPQASAALRRADDGDGVLVLTDMYGATPSNLGAALAGLGTRVHRVSGLSLPMLLRVLNYAELGLDELPAVAAAGARNGVRLDDT